MNAAAYHRTDGVCAATRSGTYNWSTSHEMPGPRSSVSGPGPGAPRQGHARVAGQTAHRVDRVRLAAEAVADWAERGLPRYGRPVNDLFPTEKGGLVPERNLWQRMRNFIDELGFPAGLDLHSFRRAYATNLQVEYGYDVIFVQLQLGHAHASTTSIYTLAARDYRARELERVLSATLARSNARLDGPTVKES